VPPLKVLLLTDYGTPTGGDELLTLGLRDALRERGHDARLLTSDARPLPAEILADETCHGTTSRWRTLLQAGNPFAAAKLRSVLARFDPDVVHLRSFLTQLSPAILPLLRDRPSLLHLDTPRAICPAGTKLLPDGRRCREPRGTVCVRSGCLPARDWIVLGAQSWLSDRWIRGCFDLCITNSAHMLERLRESGIAVDEFVWNGARIPEHPAVRDARPSVAFAGRLVREKGADVLIRAAARVLRARADVAFVIFGDGPERNALEELVRSLGIGGSVTFPGHLDRADLEARIGGASIQAVPSLWDEPFGLVTIEAMARGTPVVAAATGASVELIEDGVTGRLVAPGEDADLADALLDLLDDPAHADALGHRARAFASAHTSMDTFVDAMERLYHRVVGAR
jgi:glycosyltransferase involved in cell wall biosynthesis